MGNRQISGWQSNLPAVGIRPTIDGRLGGVRESLEQRTMSMAQSVADMISGSMRYPNGEKLRCVIADGCIGGVAESARCAGKFEQEGVGLTLTVTPCWCYGSETMDQHPWYPKAIWGFNGTERPGAVYLAATLAGHNQKGLPAFSIYGRDVQDMDDNSIPADVRDRIQSFVRAGLAAALMRGRSYLSIGSVSMGIAGSIVNEEVFQRYLGMRNEYVDMSEVSRRVDAGIFDQDEYEEALAWTRKHCRIGTDYNPKESHHSRQQLDAEWEYSVKMTLIARDLMVGNPRLAEAGFGEEALGHNALAAGFQGQRQWTDHLPNGDMLETLLNSSFDWNGTRPPFIMATENDSLNGVSMLFGHLLTATSQIFADVRTYWSPSAIEHAASMKAEGELSDGIIHLINSGSACLDGTGAALHDGKPVLKPFWDMTEQDVEACLEAASFCPAIYEYFRGGGFSTSFLTRGGMPMTMCRLNLVRGLGPALQIAEGMSVTLPDAMHEALDRRTNPSWPTTWFVPRLTGQGPFRDVYSVMANWGANHGAISYGHIGHDLITLASMLRIPVYMHNVDEERLFRPSAWAAFGMEPYGADFRACANYGPLYG